mmetsp:Transcript_27551/g.91432  ORF Transcript_27551/g.91432 Transcript_27551/m.91432 type:complete len:446 (+) Transcript_27551:154-1491(+)
MDGGRDYWERYYSRSIARRGDLRNEDCYCSSSELECFLRATGFVPATLEARFHILVVGSGTSRLPQQLAADPALDVSAMDVSETAVSWMRRVHPEVTWYIADACSMDPAWDGKFDLLIDKGLVGATSTEDAFSNRASCHRMIAEYCRVLRSCGLAVVVVPEASPWFIDALFSSGGPSAGGPEESADAQSAYASSVQTQSAVEVQGSEAYDSALHVSLGINLSSAGGSELGEGGEVSVSVGVKIQSAVGNKGGEGDALGVHSEAPHVPVGFQRHSTGWQGSELHQGEALGAPVDVQHAPVGAESLSKAQGWSEVHEGEVPGGHVYVLRASGGEESSSASAAWDRAWPPWALGIDVYRGREGSGLVLVVRTSLRSAQRQAVALSVAGEAARLVLRKDPWGGSSLDIPLTAPAKSAQWTRRGLEITLYPFAEVKADKKASRALTQQRV